MHDLTGFLHIPYFTVQVKIDLYACLIQEDDVKLQTVLTNLYTAWVHSWEGIVIDDDAIVLD